MFSSCSPAVEKIENIERINYQGKTYYSFDVLKAENNEGQVVYALAKANRYRLRMPLKVNASVLQNRIWAHTHDSYANINPLGMERFQITEITPYRISAELYEDKTKLYVYDLPLSISLYILALVDVNAKGRSYRADAWEETISPYLQITEIDATSSDVEIIPFQ